MTRTRLIGIIFLFAIVGLGGFRVGERLGVPGLFGVVSPAEARVGRPLTPVSVAGVGRRTARRCAVGAYHC
jgi:hypothetical protein